MKSQALGNSPLSSLNSLTSRFCRSFLAASSVAMLSLAMLFTFSSLEIGVAGAAEGDGGRVDQGIEAAMVSEGESEGGRAIVSRGEGASASASECTSAQSALMVGWVDVTPSSRTHRTASHLLSSLDRLPIPAS